MMIHERLDLFLTTAVDLLRCVAMAIDLLRGVAKAIYLLRGIANARDNAPPKRRSLPRDRPKSGHKPLQLDLFAGDTRETGAPH
jgi:hypothetical protein